MEWHTISKVSDFVSVVETRGNLPERFVYRGHSRASFRLIPAAMRKLDANVRAARRIQANAHETNELAHLEREMLVRFKRRALAFLKSPPPDNANWQWLALAQHHGLPTRLLDWTKHAAVALYFSVEAEDNGGEDSVVWCIESPEEINLSVQNDPFHIADVRLFRPQHIDPRIASQRSCFTIHPTAYLQDYHRWIAPDTITLFTIPNEHRKGIKDALRLLGTHRATLFPDLDGIAWFLREINGM